MNVIPRTCRARQIRYLRFYSMIVNHWKIGMFVCLFVCFLFYFFCWVHVAHYLSFLCCYFFIYVLCIVCPMFLKHFFFVIFHFYRQCKRYNTFTQDITHIVLTDYWITTDIKLFHLNLSWSELQTILYLMELFPLSFRKLWVYLFYLLLSYLKLNQRIYQFLDK